MRREQLALAKSLVGVTVGVAIYTFGFIKLNMSNHLAEGGVTGVTLIVHSFYGIDPAYISLLINIPLFILGIKILGKRSLAFTLYATILLSFFMWLWQHFLIDLPLHDDMMLVAVVAGLIAGVGSGLVFRYGATTGGTDIIGRILEVKFGFKLGQTLLIIDALVLTASLSYIDLQHMLYTLIASFVYSQVLTIVQNGGYTVRGMIIVTRYSQQVADTILQEINRGVTFLRGQGAYSKTSMDILYVVLNPSEVRDVKELLAKIDPDAFISIIDVDEVVSSDFKIRRHNYDK
ncbi:YitT family protein [Streptococcus sciuri]|uniref:YitT family protein n=1 Tax=Streptococcus sciuri TaxID=2973939 RepID=A0ABT2F7C9_9STRE|nr:YitT family protein [Streptococcus sciuri]MCS4487931.1 YitT family protein [Streptococcus sciuri]